MNAPQLIQDLPQEQFLAAKEDQHLTAFFDILLDNRWMVAFIALLGLAIAAMYAHFTQPIYESDMLIQVEDSAGTAKSYLTDALDIKTASTSEIEIIRSRMVLGPTVDSTLLHIEAKPLYLPVIGYWLSTRASSLSNPGFLWFPGYVHGRESISVQQFDVPRSLEGSEFAIVSLGDRRYRLAHKAIQQEIVGQVGTLLSATVRGAPLNLMVSALSGRPGATFTVVRRSRQSTIDTLQNQLRLAEKGRGSRVLEVTLQGTDRVQLAAVLNEIGQQYLRQNIDRLSADAEKTLTFLNTQLPTFKKQLDQAEESYNRYRSQQGSISLTDEARLILSRTVEFQSKLLEAQQRRRDLLTRFTAEHPTVRSLDDQVAAWTQELGALNSATRALPSVQQEVMRFERDVKINNELYQRLRNDALQLQLVREGKAGTVRVIDQAVVPEWPVKPRRQLIMGLGLMLGLVAAVVAALFRSMYFRGVRGPDEIEAATGMKVYSTIPLSGTQAALAKLVAQKEPGVHLLAERDPQDMAVESLRSLRTALRFALLESRNRLILITGATPGVGKSFLAANLAAVMANGAGAGKRILLVDSDLRKGYLNQYFDVPRSPGLAEVIAGDLPFDSVVHKDVVPGLDFVSTGKFPTNAADLMMSSRMAGLLDAVSAKYDSIVMDTPPILVAADTVAVAPHAGCILLVARADTTQVGELNESIKRLKTVGKQPTGAIFNALDLNRRHYGGYGYRYGAYRYKDYKY